MLCTSGSRDRTRDGYGSVFVTMVSSADHPETFRSSGEIEASGSEFECQNVPRSEGPRGEVSEGSEGLRSQEPGGTGETGTHSRTKAALRGKYCNR